MFGTLPLCLVEPYKLTNVEPTLSFCYNFLLGNQSRRRVILPIMTYTWKLHPKGLPFSGLIHIKGRNLPFSYFKGALIKIF